MNDCNESNGKGKIKSKKGFTANAKLGQLRTYSLRVICSAAVARVSPNSSTRVVWVAPYSLYVYGRCYT